MDEQHYQEWAAIQSREPMPLARCAELFLWTVQHGPPNCWTGTSGTAAAMIRELLRERIRLVELLEECEYDFPSEENGGDDVTVEIDVDEL